MNLEEPTKRRGRKPKYANDDARGSLTVRLSRPVREAVQAQASALGRSLSEHIERMLEDALRGDAVIAEIRALRDEIAPPTEVKTEFTVAGDAPREWRPPQLREPLRHS